MVKKQPFILNWDRKALDNLKSILSYLEQQSAQAPEIVKSAILSALNLFSPALTFTNPIN